MELTAVGNPLHRLYRLALHLGGQHQAGTHQSVIQQHRAGTTITGIAPNLGANQLELIAKHLSQHLTGGAQESGVLTIDGGLHGHLV